MHLSPDLHVVRTHHVEVDGDRASLHPPTSGVEQARFEATAGQTLLLRYGTYGWGMLIAPSGARIDTGYEQTCVAMPESGGYDFISWQPEPFWVDTRRLTAHSHWLSELPISALDSMIRGERR